MFAQFNEEHYLPILKWKLGEFSAAGTARRKDRLLPLFVMPPAGEFDHEAGQVLSPIDHIRSFGGRLHQHWGKRLAFVDGFLIDDERHKAGLVTHPLTELVERARLAGAIACPVTGIGRSADYQDAVKRFVQHHAPLPICIRVDGIQSEDVDGLKVLLESLSCEPSRVVLVLDLGALHLSEVEVVADLLVDRINELPFVHEWLGLAVALTSFPKAILLKPGEVGIYERNDWLVYQHLIARRGRLLRMPFFGDYALEYPSHSIIKRATPSAHLRYSTDRAYVIPKGKSTRKPNGYQTIFPVADALVARSDFSGAAFSDGDAFIHALAQRTDGPGNACTWRWATTDHHLNRVDWDIRSAFGLPHDVSEPINEDSQLRLFEDVKAR